jgi:hypothetical protein
MVSNKRLLIMAHLLSLIIQEENIKFSELTKRIYRLDKRTGELEEHLKENQE